MSYRVDVSIGNGAWAWSVTDSDAPPTLSDLTAGPLLLDQLVMAHAVTEPDGGVWPPCPDIEEATLSLWAATAAHLEGLAIGTPVQVDLYLPATAPSPWLQFAGQLGEAKVTPYEWVYDFDTTVHGVLATIPAVGRLAALREVYAADYDYPAEPMAERVARIAADLGSPVVIIDDLGGAPPRNGYATSTTTSGVDGDGPLTLPIRSGGSVTVFDALQDTIRQWPALYDAVEDTGGYCRMVLTMADPLDNGVHVTPVQSRPVIAAPLVLVDTGTTWTLEVDPTPDTRVLSGEAVDYDPDYMLTKGWSTNRVEVSGTFGGVDGKVVAALVTDQPPVTESLSTDLTSKADARGMAKLYLPEDDRTVVWSVETLTWTPEDEATIPACPQLAEFLTVAPVLQSYNPNNRPWLTGQLVEREVTVAEGRVTVDLDLAPAVFSETNVADAITFNDPILTAASGPTVAELDTLHTYSDYRLVRGTP